MDEAAADRVGPGECRTWSRGGRSAAAGRWKASRPTWSRPRFSPLIAYPKAWSPQHAQDHPRRADLSRRGEGRGPGKVSRQAAAGDRAAQSAARSEGPVRSAGRGGKRMRRCWLWPMAKAPLHAVSHSVELQRRRTATSAAEAPACRRRQLRSVPPPSSAPRLHLQNRKVANDLRRRGGRGAGAGPRRRRHAVRQLGDDAAAAAARRRTGWPRIAAAATGDNRRPPPARIPPVAARGPGPRTLRRSCRRSSWPSSTTTASCGCSKGRAGRAGDRHRQPLSRRRPDELQHRRRDSRHAT